MPNHLMRMGGAALSLVLLGALTPVLAQKKQPWVDPPAEIPAASPDTEAVEPDPGEPTPAAVTGSAPSTPSRQEAATAKRAETKAAAPSRKAAVARASEPARVRPTERPARKVAAAPARRVARAARAPERAGGLELMTLRTIEFEDGRRVTILTRPDAATIERFTSD